MEVSHFLRFEKLRDGGSLIASFQSSDSCQYWVMFPIVNGDQSHTQFREPVLVNRTTGIEVNLSSMGAKQWLKMLLPYFEQRPDMPHFARSLEIDILNKMLELCEINT
jgi:hypothetical protein